ncbi:MAG TPA: bleomycin resistance family protein [Pyrinomonadaceae bacterium]|nr:bleomycin resistance family protein [Pyrinomonadaceae bacterium]
MKVEHITPILNVSDMAASFAWFQSLGWRKLWDWGEPPTFGAVGCGNAEIFLCLDGQGGRGPGSNTKTFGEEGGQTADRGCWMSVWVDDVDAAHNLAIEQDIEVMMPPTDMPWGVRELHIRHPDGHVFRVGRVIEPEAHKTVA